MRSFNKHSPSTYYIVGQVLGEVRTFTANIIAGSSSCLTEVTGKSLSEIKEVACEMGFSFLNYREALKE